MISQEHNTVTTPAVSLELVIQINKAAQRTSPGLQLTAADGITLFLSISGKIRLGISCESSASR